MANRDSRLDFLYERHSKRAFLDRPVPRELLTQCIDAAGQAVSSKNTQPWELSILEGRAKDELSTRLCTLFDADTPISPDYPYSPKPLPEPFKARARDCGYGIFTLKGIAKDDYAARKAHGRENFEFFGAPTAIIFHTADSAEKGTFLDLGAYLQSFLLALSAVGLGACPQYSVAYYPDTIRDCLGLPESQLIVCGISLGYPDPDAKVNKYIPTRLDVTEFTRWTR